MSLKRSQDDYDSSFEGDAFIPKRNRSGDPLFQPQASTSRPAGLPVRSSMNDASCATIGQTLRYHQSSLTAYDRHKMLMNQYLLYHPGAPQLLKRDTSGDKRDMDVVREHHQFLWSPDDEPDTWERRLAKKYYDKLFREYCICDLSRYTENKIGMRWRTEKEVQDGKGQFSCGAKRCDTTEGLASWEMNFAYVEQDVKKNALIKLRLCEPCSLKLNFCHKRVRATKKRRKRSDRSSNKEPDSEDAASPGRATSAGGSDQTDVAADTGLTASSSTTGEESQDQIWKGPAKLPDEKTREDEFEQYLEDLLL